MTDNAPAPGAPDEALRAEVGKIMADPMWGKDPALADRVNKMYQDKYGSGEVVIGEGLSVGGQATPQEGQSPEAAEEAKRNEVILQPLRQEWGQSFEANFSAARVEARALFAGDDGVVQPQVFEDLGSRIRTLYGPKGEALAIRFLSDLGKLRKGG